jgi:hypothetical protein
MTTNPEARPTGINRTLATTCAAIVALLVFGCLAPFYLGLNSTDKQAQRRHEIRMHCDALRGQLVEGWAGDERIVLCIAPERR